MSLAKISQTTSVQCKPEDLRKFMSQQIPIISADAAKPSLVFFSPDFHNHSDGIVHWSLFAGLYKLNWKSYISKFEPMKLMVSECKQSPFISWKHTQITEIKGLKIYLQDEVEFEAEDKNLGELLSKAIFRYQFEALLDDQYKKATQKIQTIQQKLA